MSRQKKNKGPLTIRERTIIEVRYRDGNSLRAIATELDRNVGTISREIDGKQPRGIGKYIADVAHRKALQRIQNRGNISKMKQNDDLKEYVIGKLKIGWSPEQITMRLPIEYPKDKTMRISYEAIYQHIYAQIHRGGHGRVKKDCEDLRSYLPRKRKRRMKKGFRKAQKLERRSNLPSIDNRPDIATQRKRIGDWEDDYLVSRQSKVCIKSVNERRSGIVFFGKTKDGTAVSGDVVLCKKLSAVPSEYLKTLTRDNGAENKDYEVVEKKLGLDVYFAHPYHSWERGSNENCNGLLRRYFPKGTDWNLVTDQEISEAEYLINTRPRKRHNGFTPAEVFYKETGVALFV